MALQLKNKSYTPAQGSVSLTAYTASGNTVLNSITIHEGTAGATVNVYLYNDADATVTTIKQLTTTTDGDQVLSAPLGMQVGDEIRVNVSRTGPTFVFSEALSTGSLSGVSLDALSDVNAGSPTANDSLVWNGSSWVPQAVTGGSGSSTLDGLTDTSITSIQSGQFLQWNSLDWVNITPTTDHIAEGSNLYHTDARVDARIALADFGDLADVDMTTSAPSIGDGLEWDGTNWVPTTSAGGNHAFHQIAVAGEQVVEADSANDILELAEGAGIAITTDAVNDKITFTVDATADEIDDASTTNKFVTAGDITKLGHISVTQAVDLDTMETTIGTNTGIALAAATAANTASNDLSAHEGSIENHDDVTFSFTGLNRPNEAFIVWNDVSQRWEDQTISIDKCNDVDTATATPSVGDVLEWDGSNWVPTTPTTGGGGTNVHDTDSTFTNVGDYDAGADIMDFTTTAITLAAGKIYALINTGWAVSHNVDSTSGSLLAICGSGATDGSDMVVRGLVKVSDTLSGNIGSRVYLGTGSKLTMTAPTSGASVVVVGRLIDATNNIVWFDPDSTQITLQ